jgi:O-antigen ligase
MIAALMVIIFLFFVKSPKLQYKSLFSFICFITTILCVGQASYGILQYFNGLPAVNGFRVTGSFDNPAGFAACLCAGFPFVFYFVFSEKPWKRYAAIIAGIILVVAVVLSASRAGIISIIAVCLAVFFYKIKMTAKWKWAIAIALLLISLSGLYFLKKDSADGRLLIWQCSWEMFMDKPFSGFGHGGFKANYMNYQAKYFEEHPDSDYAMLADNVNRPFNEYLLLVINYGLTGFTLLLILAWFLWRLFLRCRHESMVRLAGSCLLSIAVFAFFSYPLRYPFVWIMGTISICIILNKSECIAMDKFIHWGKHSYFFAVISIMTLSICQLACKRMSAEMKWCEIAHQSLLGKTKQMLPAYERLHKLLVKNELFLYNYAAELNVTEHYEESLQIARECERLWADYDLQMLMADNYRQTERYEKAEQCYQKATAMCPVRFMPLYELAKIYLETGKETEALLLANTILEKKIKVPSATVFAIKKEMRELINRINNKHNILEERQDKVSSEELLETVLPP